MTTEPSNPYLAWRWDKFWKNPENVRKVGEDLARLEQEDPAQAARVKAYLARLQARFKDEAIQKTIKETRGHSDYEKERQLNEWGFPIWKDELQKLKLLLIKNWQATTKIVKAAIPKHISELFYGGLPACKDFIHSTADLETLARIAEAVTRPEHVLFIIKCGLPRFQYIIRNTADLEKAGLALVKIATTAKPEHVSSLIEQGLPTFQYIIRNTADLEKAGLALTRIAEAIKRFTVLALFEYSLPACKDFIRNTQDLEALARIAEATKPEDVYDLFLHGLPACKDIIHSTADLEALARIAEATKPELIYNLFHYGLPACKDIIHNTADLERAGLIIAEIIAAGGTVQLFLLVHSFEDLERLQKIIRDNKSLFRKNSVIKSFIGFSSLDNLEQKIPKLKEMIRDKNYHRVEGITRYGYLCVHSTNAFFGGNAGNKNQKKDPYLNIVNDINNTYDFNPSCSIIKPGLKPSIAIRRRWGINGSIGVIFDIGVIYAAYSYDVGTSDKKLKNGRTIRITDMKTEKAALVANFSESSYNEVLLSKWTVGAIFYTKGVPKEVIERLKRISEQESFKDHLNGKHLRLFTFGFQPKHVKKVFPIFEIDTSTNEWRLVYLPRREGWTIKHDEKTMTWTAIPTDHDEKTMTLSANPTKKTQNTLNREELNSVMETYTIDNLINFFRKEYAEIFSWSVGVWEGYSLETHIKLVLTQFDRYFAHRTLTVSKLFFRVFLVLHDLGKPLAVKKGRKDLQHQETLKLIEPLLRQLEFSSREIKIALALVQADPIGSYIKDGSLHTTTKQIKEMAKKAGIPVKEFYQLLLIYYKCDAGSYTRDAGGKESLDRLFQFDHHERELQFSATIQEKIDALTQQLLK